MRLSEEKGRQLVRELSSILPYPINVMDETGTIIASADETRIGTLHAGAQRILQEGLRALTVLPGETMAGAAAGINLPIRILGETVGVIGITGDPAAVTVYGRIIQKMTEILLMDLYQNDQRRLFEQARDTLVHEWLFGTQPLPNPSFETRAKLLHIDLASGRVVATLRVRAAAEDGEAYLRLLEYVRAQLSARGDILILEENRLTLLLRAQKETRAAVADLVKEMETRFRLRVACGLSVQRHDYTEMRRAYQESVLACDAAAYRPGRVVAFDELTIEPVLTAIPAPMREYYLNRVLGGYSGDALESCLATLAAFFRCDGSISAAAQEQYVHKNTFQYRLRQIAAHTGLDPRKPSQAPLLYIAMLLASLPGNGVKPLPQMKRSSGAHHNFPGALPE